MNDLRIVTRSLRVRAVSTSITVAMVAVSVAILLVIFSMRQAGERAFSRGTGNMHLLVSRDPSPLNAVLNSVFYAGVPANPIEWWKFQQLASQHPFEYAIPVVTSDSFRSFRVLATEPEFFTRFRPAQNTPWEVDSGRLFENDFEVVLGSVAAEQTGLGLGDRIFLTHGVASETAHIHREFAHTVVGTLKPTGTIHDRAIFSNLRSSWILHAHDRRLKDDPGVTFTTADDLIEEDMLITAVYLRVATRPGWNISASIQPTYEALRRDPSVTVASPAEEINRLFAIVSSIDQILIALAIAVLLSSTIAVGLALYNTMWQRRKQTAVLRVLGFSRPRVLRIVLLESALVGLLGALGGVLFSLVGASAAAGALQARVGLFVTPTHDPLTILSLVGATTLLAALAGLGPAMIAYRTPVAKHLRAI